MIFGFNENTLQHIFSLGFYPEQKKNQTNLYSSLFALEINTTNTHAYTLTLTYKPNKTNT